MILPVQRNPPSRHQIAAENQTVMALVERVRESTVRGAREGLDQTGDRGRLEEIQPFTMTARVGGFVN
jgi:hypothetical protein